MTFLSSCFLSGADKEREKIYRWLERGMSAELFSLLLTVHVNCVSVSLLTIVINKRSGVVLSFPIHFGVRK